MPKKKNQTAGKPSKNIPARTNSVFSESLLGTSPIDRKKITEKKQTRISKKELDEALGKALSLIDIDTQIEDTITEKTVNVFDRLQALSRMPEVRKALDEIESEKNLNRRNGLIVEFFEKYNESYNTLKNIRKRKSYDPNVVRALCNFEKDSKGLLRYRDGKHLIIAVNLTKKNRDIFSEFEQIIKQAKKDYRIPKDNTKDKTPMLDIWKIYDLRNKSMKWSEVTACIWRKYSKDNQRQAIRYYNKASEIYASVKASINSRDDR